MSVMSVTYVEKGTVFATRKVVRLRPEPSLFLRATYAEEVKKHDESETVHEACVGILRFYHGFIDRDLNGIRTAVPYSKDPR